MHDAQNIRFLLCWEKGKLFNMIRSNTFGICMMKHTFTSKFYQNNDKCEDIGYLSEAAEVEEQELDMVGGVGRQDDSLKDLEQVAVEDFGFLKEKLTYRDKTQAKSLEGDCIHNN